MPLQHRHEYAAGIPRGLPAGDHNRFRSRPIKGVRCHPTRVHQVWVSPVD